MPNTRAVTVALLLCLAVSAVAMAGGPFLGLSLVDALARAKEEKKIVFIDFFAAWCGPCKQLDSTTFADKKVIEWLGKHTVPLKIDVDRNRDVAKRFGVRSMPTLVFIATDGTELRRITGYKDSDAFLEIAAEIIEHPEKDAVARAREELETGYWPEAMARHKLGTALLMAGEKDQALTEYVKALDSLGTDPLSVQYRDRLMGDICSLAACHPPAREVVDAERETLVAGLESGEGGREELEKIITIDIGLDQTEQTLALYDRLEEREDIPLEVLAGFCTVCRKALLERGDYEGVSTICRWSLSGTLRRIESIRRQRELVAGNFGNRSSNASDKLRERYANMTEEEKAAHLARTEKFTISHVTEDYEITRGLGKTTDAMAIAEKLLELCPTAEVNHALAAGALRSGKPAKADLGYATRAVELDRGRTPEYVLTRFELMEHFEKAGEGPDGPVASSAEDDTAAGH